MIVIIGSFFFAMYKLSNYNCCS